MRNLIGKRIGAAALLFGLLAVPAPAGQRPSPLDDILKSLALYDGGLASEAYWKLREYVRDREDDPAGRADCEIRLLTFLRSAATAPAKTLVCRELRLVAGEKSIPTLQPMLLDPALADPARYVLEKVPGPAADKAFVTALERTSGTLKTGIISSVGARKMAEAVPALAKYLEGSALEFVKAAATALGQIGGKEAAAALAKALPSLRGDFKTTAASALLDCAEGILKGGDAAAAVSFYDKILSVESSPAIIEAATMGKIAASGDQAKDLILAVLKTADPIKHEAAIAKIKDVFPPGGAEPLVEVLPSLTEESRVKLLAVLGGYPGENVVAAIRQAADSESSAVRVAALKALGRAGMPSDVLFLAGRAASGRGDEAAAARTSLAVLKGRAVDEAVVKALGGDAGDDVRGELIAAVGERRMFAAKSALVVQLSSPNEQIRVQAVKTLRTIGTPSDIPALLALLDKAGSEAEREGIENAAAALAQKIAQSEGRSNIVKMKLSEEREPARRAGLIRVLGKIGDDSALPILRRALQEPDAGVVDAAARAIAGWPNPTPIEDVWQLAKSAGDETQKLLALRGFIRMTALGKYRRPDLVVGDLKLAAETARRPEEKRLVLAALPNFACPEALEKYRRPDLVVGDLKLAAETARRPEEKRLVLAALPNFACPEALALAQSLAADPEVKAEAQAAVGQIKKKLGGTK